MAIEKEAEGMEVAEAPEAPQAAEEAAPPEAKAEAGEEAKEEAKDGEAMEVDAEAEAAGEEPKAAAATTEPEEPKEQEEDAVDDGRARLNASAAAINTSDTTLNVLPVSGGKVLMSLSEGGFQYLLAGARSTVGLKSGRYMFEARILLNLSPAEAQGSQARTPQPRQLLRLGVSTAGSSLFLSDGPENVCFDSEGYFVYERSRKKVAQKFTRDQTVALLVNLDPKSPNANTISLFRNGVRISQPQAIPERLQGKVLYPTLTYKNVSLQVNFGPTPQAPLPFTCDMVACAAQEDAVVATQPKPKDGKWEVLFPVGLPEQGYFDWVDDFVEKNPDYVELSDRKILEWASKSGLWRSKAQPGAGSNDKPDMKFGIPLMDDYSVRKVLSAVAPTQSRNFIVPELASNLIACERGEAMKRFGTADFKRSATVIMGEPTSEYKEKVQALILESKKVRAEAEKKKRSQEEERRRLLEEKRKKAEEARKAKEAAQKKKEGKEVKEAKEAKAEPPKEEENKEEEAKKEDDDIPLELTEEEKAMCYRKLDAPDLNEQTLAKSYASFSLPKTEEGFDAITFAWQTEAASADILKQWVMERKKTQKVEDLQPGATFKRLWSKWTKTLQEWKKIQTDYNNPVKRKAMIAKRKEDAKNKKAESGEGEDKGEEKEEEAKPVEINVEDLDVLAVEDVTDIGNGEPLFQHFAYEDWALLSIRYELHLLLHSFQKDLDDPDRPSFTEEHMAFYYNKYFKRPFSLKQFAVEGFQGFLELVSDTVTINKATLFLDPVLDAEKPLANFVKTTENNRRERQRRIDAGDETAKLKFNRPAPPQQRDAPAGPQSSSRSGGGSARPAGGAPPKPPRPPSGPGSARPASYGHSSSPGNGRNGTGGSGYSSQRGSAPPQKRPYSSTAPPSSWSTSKYSRTSSYSGGSSYGSGSSYYRR